MTARHRNPCFFGLRHLHSQGNKQQYPQIIYDVFIVRVQMNTSRPTLNLPLSMQIRAAPIVEHSNCGFAFPKQNSVHSFVAVHGSFAPFQLQPQLSPSSSP